MSPFGTGDHLPYTFNTGAPLSLQGVTVCGEVCTTDASRAPWSGQVLCVEDPGGPSSPVLPVTNQLPGQCLVVCFTHMAVRGEVVGTKAMYTSDHMGEQF